jgi:pimeloyl-ACP methyl ester carboxylesterase
MKSIEGDIASFRALRPPHFVTFKTAKRTMRLAWNGNPAKRPLLFVHGSPGSWEAWAQFLQNPKLAEEFHLLAVDRPGYGGSSAGDTEKNLSQQADDIIQALQVNKSGLPAILVGHSFGGPVIAQMAVNHPEKVAGLVFVASSVDPDLEEIKWYQHVGTWWPFRALIPRDLRVCNEEIYELKPQLETLRTKMRLIAVPVMIIHGDKDPLVPVGNVSFLQKTLSPGLIKGATILQGMNHFIPWKSPTSILDSIESLRQLLK